MRRLTVMALALMALGACTSVPTTSEGILVEAENFAVKGGWSVDQQFTFEMGSPYLIAHGMGRPVGDASTEVTIPAAGQYHVYVRTYNWTSPWSDKSGPGAFTISVGGSDLEAVLDACLREADVESPLDLEHIKLALQGYNYGNGYISWAKENYGGYSAANASEFSDMMAAQLGWSSYGDKEYVAHVLRYYPYRVLIGMGGSSDLVEVALAQEGYIGGEMFWRWYGFDTYQPWCACFVSWCADQCGYIDAGVIPRFSLCSAGVEWFREKGRFMDSSYIPTPGDLIFFDWENDGSINHVGIVVSVENGFVNTIEGNSGDKVARQNYPIGYAQIEGYGVL